MSGVAQAVVDQVVRLHHERLELLQVRASTTEDITLLIREFGPCINMESKTLTHNSSRFISIIWYYDETWTDQTWTGQNLDKTYPRQTKPRQDISWTDQT